MPCVFPRFFSFLFQHGTCPICRQSLGDQNSADVNQDTVGPSLAALFRYVICSILVHRNWNISLMEDGKIM